VVVVSGGVGDGVVNDDVGEGVVDVLNLVGVVEEGVLVGESDVEELLLDEDELLEEDEVELDELVGVVIELELNMSEVVEDGGRLEDLGTEFEETVVEIEVLQRQ
jgi:hypothetical protein